jgi:hypothetical protein
MWREVGANPAGSQRNNATHFGRVVAFAAAVLVSLTACSGTVEETGGQLEGVWQLEEMLIVGADGQATRSPLRASLYIFTERHYSMMVRLGDDTLPPFTVLWSPTDEEKTESFDRLGGNSGSYETDGSSMVLSPIVARGDVMGGRELIDFNVSADTLRLAIVGLRSPDGTANQFYESGGRTLLRLLRVR